MRFTNYVIPQVPGSIKRSRPAKGVVESAFKAKKYMVPLLMWHPAIVGCFAAVYFTGRGGFDPGRDALVFDPSMNLQSPMSAQERREYQSRVGLLQRDLAGESDAEVEKWSRLEASAEPMLDAEGRPAWRVRAGETAAQIGLTRGNIVGGSESASIARELLMVRLRDELRRSAGRTDQKTVGNDLALLRQLNESRARERTFSGGDAADMETASKLR